MSQSPRTHGRHGIAAGLLAAVVGLLVACGRGDVPSAGSPGTQRAAPADLRPVGGMNEFDTKLFEAAGMGDVAGATAAIDAGANVDAADKLKRTALFNAAFYNQPALVDLLLGRGADVHAKDLSGFSPLHAAVVAGAKEVVAVLLARDIGINDRVVGGRTALHLAAATNQAAMVDLLLQYGANTHLKDSDGLSPAALAARNDHGPIAAKIRRWAETHK